MSFRVKDQIKYTSNVFVYVVIVFVIGVVLTFATWKLKPVWLGLERQAFKASHQYIDTRVTELSTYSTQYRELSVRINQTDNIGLSNSLKAQQKALLVQIKESIERIPVDEIPESVKSILKENDVMLLNY